jgi:hypothetical protein
MKTIKQRERTLIKASPRAGWGPGWTEQIDELWRLLSSQHPELHEAQTRTRLALLFRRASDLLEIKVPGNKKPTTFIRDQLEWLLALPEGQAIEHLKQPQDALADYLDVVLEAHDPEFRAGDVAKTPDELAVVAQRRYALLKEQGRNLVPRVERGPEAVWPTIAELVAVALIDVTGKWPGRVVGIEGSSEGEEKGWGPAFFQAFAGMVELSRPSGGPGPQTSFVKVWRKTLVRLEATGRRPEPPPLRSRRRK